MLRSHDLSSMYGASVSVNEGKVDAAADVAVVGAAWHDSREGCVLYGRVLQLHALLLWM